VGGISSDFDSRFGGLEATAGVPCFSSKGERSGLGRWPQSVWALG